LIPHENSRENWDTSHPFVAESMRR